MNEYCNFVSLSHSLPLLFVIVKIWDFFVLSKLLHFRRNLPLPRVRQLRDGDGGRGSFFEKIPRRFERNVYPYKMSIGFSVLSTFEHIPQ